MTAEKIEQWCKRCYVAVGVLTFIVAFFLIFVVGNRGAVVQYGGPGSIKIVNAVTGEPVIQTGDPVNICFSDLKWLRKCDTVVIEQVLVGGVVYNLPVHRVSPSPNANKCRALETLAFPSNFKGDVKFNGTAISTCWPTDKVWPIETPLPEAHFTVK